VRGASFGLRQSLDTVGAFVGPLLAIALMWWTADSFRAVFWIAVAPAFLSLALILFAVEEPERPPGIHQIENPLSLEAIKRLGQVYWRVVIVGVVFALARFSEAFLILRAQNVGLGLTWVPIVLVGMNVVYALSAYPAGVLSDRLNRKALLAAGLVMLAGADLALAVMPNLGGVAIGVALWGLHMGFTQGLFAALVADAAPAELRGTAFGYFNLLTGLAMLAASVIAGALWDAYGPPGTFFAGLVFALVALFCLLTMSGKISGAAAE
jgi:MFS family permease